MLGTHTLDQRPRLLRAARAAAIALAVALAGRAQLMLGLAPFALALFAAGLYARENPAALLAGCALAALRFPLEKSDLLLPAGCALILVGALLLDGRRWRGRLREDTRCALLSGLGALLPGLAAARLEVYASMLAVAAASVAVACAGAFCALLAWRPDRAMSADARAAAALGFFALLAGMRALWPPGGYCAACLAALAAAHASMGAGAAVGALSACALLCGGETMATAASVCLGAAAAGLLRPRGRLYAAPGFMLAVSLAGLYAPEAYLGPVMPAVAALGYVAAPEAWLDALAQTALRPGGREHAARQEAVRALNALGEAFGEMAAGVANLPDEEAVLVDMRSRLCADCSGYERCWAGDDGRAVRALCRALRDAADEAEPPNAQAPPDIARVCRRGERLQLLAWEQARCLRARRAQQPPDAEMFRQAERVLRGVSRSRARPRDPARRAAMEWGASARSMLPGTPSGDAHLLRRLPDGRMLALLCDGMGSGKKAREESERAVRLLWKFLSARVEPEAALSATNALLIRRGAGDMFATADLCLIDERAARARFWKQAASRSLIARAGETLVVEGGRLPLGMVEGVKPLCAEVELHGGDVIVMGSDGAMEAGEGAVEGVLAQKWTLSPDRLSEELLRAADAAVTGGRRDDMTVMCVHILPAKARSP